MAILLTKFLADEQGATAIEYAFIALIVGIGIITGLNQIAPAFNNRMTEVGTSL
jgi:Flp pilus assembly pilin Flp